MAALNRRQAPPDRRGCQAGFAMVEALIAFAVMAVGLGTLAGGIAVALRADARSTSTLAALRTAQSLYAQAGISAPLGSATGEDQHGFRWRIVARPAQVAPPKKPSGPMRSQAMPPGPGPTLAGPGLVWMSVAVEAPGGGRAELAGLKPLARPGAPR